MKIEDVWQQKGDYELLEAAASLREFTDEGRQTILQELQRRGLQRPAPAEIKARTVRGLEDSELREIAGQPGDYPEATQKLIELELRRRESLVGIRGWLVLPALGLIAAPIVDLFTAFEIWNAWEEVAALAGERGERVTIILVTALALCAGLIVLDIATAACFFLKKSIAPTLIIVWVLVRLIARLGMDGFWLSSFEWDLADPLAQVRLRALRDQLATDTLFAFLGACIWILYFLVSRRVKNTFRRPADRRTQSTER